MLNEKMFQLIQLLKRGHSPLTSGMLAQQLKLSARTCKRYIAELIPLLEQHGEESSGKSLVAYNFAYATQQLGGHVI